MDDGDTVSLTLKKEFSEEAARLNSKEDQETVEAIFRGGPHQHLVYQGYIDDPRNTDNAWMESTAQAFVCSPGQAALLRFERQEVC